MFSRLSLQSGPLTEARGDIAGSVTLMAASPERVLIGCDNTLYHTLTKPLLTPPFPWAAGRLIVFLTLNLPNYDFSLQKSPVPCHT